MLQRHSVSMLVGLWFAAASAAPIRAGTLTPCDGALSAASGSHPAVNAGAVCTLDPTTFAGTIRSSPVAGGGFTGRTFTSDGRLWGTVQYGITDPAHLVELHPTTGALI